MSDILKSVIQDLINDRAEQAQVSIHQYIVGKTQQVAGLAEAKAPKPAWQGGKAPTKTKILKGSVKERDRDDYVVDGEFTDEDFDALLAAAKSGADATIIDRAVDVSDDDFESNYYIVKLADGTVLDGISGALLQEP